MAQPCLPNEAIDDSLTRVLIAVLAEHRPTFATCVTRSGLSLQTVHDRLHRLRAMGLIAFEDHTNGTLRPMVRAYRPRGNE